LKIGQTLRKKIGNTHGLGWNRKQHKKENFGITGWFGGKRRQDQTNGKKEGMGEEKAHHMVKRAKMEWNPCQTTYPQEHMLDGCWGRQSKTGVGDRNIKGNRLFFGKKKKKGPEENKFGGSKGDEKKTGRRQPLTTRGKKGGLFFGEGRGNKKAGLFLTEWKRGT